MPPLLAKIDLAQRPEDPRQAQRVDLSVEVTLHSDHNFYTGLSRNVSSGGLFVVTCGLRDQGTVLRISFTLPGLASPIVTAHAGSISRACSIAADRSPGDTATCPTPPATR